MTIIYGTLPIVLLPTMSVNMNVNEGMKANLIAARVWKMT